MELKRWQKIGTLIFAVVALVLIAIATSTTAHLEGGVYATAWSLLPPILAICLALITKEVYVSLFVGIFSGGLLAVGGLLHPLAAMEHSLSTMVESLADSWNIGILIFLVVLGTIVALMNKAGGSRAYGEWAIKNIKSRRGAQLATFGLGILIFVDDYFNCLTVGAVMRPVTDSHKISRSKLAYLIDATAAPICIIAPISSWAAAVAGTVEGTDGLTLFIQAIPYNYYALLTLLMVFVVAYLNLDFGPMKLHEENAVLHDDLYTTPDRPYEGANDAPVSSKGKVYDLIIPVVILISLCIVGMIYTGGFFSGEAGIVDAFANSDASYGLMLGSMIALIVCFVYFMARRVLTFAEFAAAIPMGFKAMVPAIIILTFAWTIGSITKYSLGAPDFVYATLNSSAQALQNLLPAIIFLVALGLAFATGTSWGTFAIMVPVVLPAAGAMGISEAPILAAALSGGIFGDHASPISNTTIIASMAAATDHTDHVRTQLPYCLIAGALTVLAYLLVGALA